MKPFLYLIILLNGGFMSVRFCLCEPCSLFFVIDKTLLSYFPSINTVADSNKCLHSKIHRTLYLTFKYMIMSIVLFMFSLVSITCTTLWYFQLVLYLNNDISKNPGPQFQSNFLNLILYSIVKDNFHRVSLIEAHNSLFTYDLISICETCLNDLVELPGILLDEYPFVPVNNPAYTIRGGVGLFYKKNPFQL